MIILSEDYAIDVTDTSYVLCRINVSQGEKTSGELLKYPVGYFKSLEGALKKHGEELVRDNLKNVTTSLTNAIQTIVESNKRVEKLIADAMKGGKDVY